MQGSMLGAGGAGDQLGQALPPPDFLTAPYSFYPLERPPPPLLDQTVIFSSAPSGSHCLKWNSLYISKLRPVKWENVSLLTCPVYFNFVPLGSSSTLAPGAEFGTLLHAFSAYLT